MRFPGFEGEWIGTKLGKIADIFDGTHQTPKYVNSGVKFVSVENINDLDNTDKFITKEDFETEYKIKPRIGDILMTRITAGIIGATAIVQNDDPLAYYVSLALIRIKDRTNVQFLAQRIETDEFKQELHKRIIHVAFPKKINLGDIQDCLVSIPSVLEQNKIADFLSIIDHRIQTQSKIIENLESLMQGFREKIFSQKLRFKDDNGNEFPDWQLKRLGDVCTITMGQSPNSTSYNTNEIGIPLIQGNADILNRNTFPRNWTTDVTKECKIGDLILTVRAPVGAVAKSLHNACIGRGVCAISINSKYPIEFIYQYLIYFEDKWSKLEQGSTFTAISGNEIKKIELNIPCIKEQFQIADFLFKIDKKIQIEKNLLDRYKKQKSYFLHELFL